MNLFQWFLYLFGIVIPGVVKIVWNNLYWIVPSTIIYFVIIILIDDKWGKYSKGN